MKRRGWVFWVVVGLLSAAVLVFAAGCDNLFGDLFGDDNDDEDDPNGVHVIAENEWLTVSVGVMHEYDDLSLRAAVTEPGKAPKGGSIIADGLAGVGQYGGAFLTVREVINEFSLGDNWEGQDGKEYDVHIWMVHTYDNNSPNMEAEGNLHYKNAPYTYTKHGRERIELTVEHFGGVVRVEASGLKEPKDPPDKIAAYYFSAWLYEAGETNLTNPEKLIARSEDVQIHDEKAELRSLMISEGDSDAYSDKEWVGELGKSYDLYLQVEGRCDEGDSVAAWYTKEAIAVNGLTLIDYRYNKDDWEEWED